MLKALDLTEEVSVVDTAPVFVGTYSYILKGEYRGFAVAVKVLRPLSVTMHAMRRKISRELEVWAHMDHPNIVPLLGYTSESKLFGPLGSFISPWYPNGDAAIFLGLHGNEMTMDQRKKLWDDVVAGVCYLHTNAPVIIHGDLKPKNILIDDQGIAKICDFGLVRIFLDEGHSGHTTTSEHTGTDRYLAYELVASQDASQLSTASDVYALGCVGLELLFLQIPHHARKSNRFGEIFQDIRNGVPPASRPSFVSSQDAYLWNLLESCWTWLPDDRVSARDIQESLLNTSLVKNQLKPVSNPEGSIITSLHGELSMDIDAIGFPITAVNLEAPFPNETANASLSSGVYTPTSLMDILFDVTAANVQPSFDMNTMQWEQYQAYGQPDNMMRMEQQQAYNQTVPLSPSPNTLLWDQSNGQLPGGDIQPFQQQQQQQQAQQQFQTQAMQMQPQPVYPPYAQNQFPGGFRRLPTRRRSQSASEVFPTNLNPHAASPYNQQSILGQEVVPTITFTGAPQTADQSNVGFPHGMSYPPPVPIQALPSHHFLLHETTSFQPALGMKPKQQGQRAEVDEKLLHEAFTQASNHPDKALRALLETIRGYAFYLDESLEPVQGSEVAEQIFAQVRQVVPDDPRFAPRVNGGSHAGTSSAHGEQASSTKEAQSIYMLFTENNVCLICGKKTHHSTRALGHVRSDIGHRPFHCDCEMCSSSTNPRRFFSESLLDDHQKGQKVKQKCPICQDEFRRGRMSRHMDSKHLDHPDNPNHAKRLQQKEDVTKSLEV